ncbi:sensor histidine kinase, partial [Nonomuraea basaltis]
MRLAVEGLRQLGAVAAGAVTAPAELAFVLLTLPFPGHPNAAAAARGLARLEARRLRLDTAALDALDGDDGRALRYLAARVPAGVLGGLVVMLLVV